jgi:hypothetical protein
VTDTQSLEKGRLERAFFGISKLTSLALGWCEVHRDHRATSCALLQKKTEAGSCCDTGWEAF